MASGAVITNNNLNIILTNALCCISEQAVKVSKLYSIGDKCADSELQKLKLMNDWFEALKCYNTEESVNSKFLLKVEYNIYAILLKAPSNVNYSYNITINGILYSVNGDGVTSIVDLINILILSAPGIISTTVTEDPDNFTPRYVYSYIEADCDITNINYKVIQISDGVILTNVDWTMYQQGVCTITNCLAEESFNIIVTKLMKECDICECQLNQ